MSAGSRNLEAPIGDFRDAPRSLRHGWQKGAWRGTSVRETGYGLREEHCDPDGFVDAAFNLLNFVMHLTSLQRGAEQSDRLRSRVLLW